MTKANDFSRTGSRAVPPGSLRELHRAVLRRFLTTGTPPTARWLRQAAAELGLDAGAVGELAAADAVHVSNGVVAVAYPLSGTPTRQRVELDGLPAVFAMCAIDALGLPFMTSRDGRISATDPYDETAVSVAVRGGAWTWDPVDAVIIAQCGSECTSGQAMCSNTTFHASRDSAAAYLASRPDLCGEILGQHSAIECGRIIFGTLLGGTV
jgi:hypothetical protein